MPVISKRRPSCVLQIALQGAMFHIMLGSVTSLSAMRYTRRLAEQTPRFVSVTASRRGFSKVRMLPEDGSQDSRKKDIIELRSGKKKTINKFHLNKKRDPREADKLAAAFDQLAQKEGFDSDSSHFASDSSFEKDFDDVTFLDDDEERKSGNQSDEEREFLSEEIRITKSDDSLEEDLDDFGVPETDCMEDRIAAAKIDMDLGRVSVPKELDAFASDVSVQTLRELGFKRELDPFQGDETPRREKYKLEISALVCSACGSNFQAKDESKPGFLPPDKFSIQNKLAKIEEIQKIEEKAKNLEWSTDDEIDWLLKTGGRGSQIADELDIDALARNLGIDLDKHLDKTVICKRCHGLQNYGQVENSLRPGWSEDPMLGQEKFRELLRPLAKKNAIVIAVVDLFDFAGSVLPELDNVVGDNPVIVAANKADLLPVSMGPVRVENWVRRELEYMGVQSLANVGGAVRLVSSKSGRGIMELLEKAQLMAEDRDCDIYLVGAANAGKSTMLNYILSKVKRPENGSDSNKKLRAGNQNKKKNAITTSPLPGTTLNFLKVELEHGRHLYDTPGLLVPGSLTQMLTPQELKIVVPKKKVEPLTLRLTSGKCVMIGGVARVALVGESRPFLFTFFVANDIKLHQTDISKSEEVLRKHAGELLKPPLPPISERLAPMGEWDDHIVDVQGNTWKEAAADIALTGLGWVAVTGPGNAQVKVSVPKGIAVSVRPPLMPFDIWHSLAKYTGGRPVRKVSKNSRGKGRGIGRI